MSTCHVIPRYLRGIFLLLLSLLFPWMLHSQVSLEYAIDPSQQSRFRIVEKENMRQRLNGVYAGFVHNEVRGNLFEKNGTSREYHGNFYILKSMTRDALHVARQIDDVVSIDLSFSENGEMLLAPEAEYPMLRDFPRLPAASASPGDRWQSRGVRVVDPLRRGATRIPFLCEYEYLGTGDYNGSDAHILRARYALRYRRGEDPYGDQELSSLQGSHVVDIYVPVKRDFALFMRDVVEEEYRYSNGNTVRRSGFILTWLEDFPSMDRNTLKEELDRQMADKKLDDIIIEERDEGVAITLENLQFHPDSPQLLPGEMGKLKSIAQALLEVPDRSFIVTGHTADVGSMESQYELSVQRAKAIVDLLTGEGLEAERFLYRGVGGSEPVGSNETEEGRRRNRRVEIIIVED